MALAFHWRGDNAWVNSVSEEPFLDPVTGALLLAGVSAAIVCALRGSRRWALVLLSLFFLTLASTLALAFPVENPAINRAAVALPSVLVLAALPVAWIWGESRRRRLAERLGVTVACLVLAAASIKENFESYFVRFAHENTVILEPVLDMVRVLREYGARGVPPRNVYLLNRNYWVDGRCINFEIGDMRWSDAHDVSPSRPVPFIRDRPLLFFFHANDPDRRQQLKAMFPDGEEKLIPTGFSDRAYYTYFVPRPDGAPATP
jgi:hypothetical protein